MMRWQRAGSVVEALKFVVQAPSIDFSDAAKLTALVQNAQGSEEENDFGRSRRSCCRCVQSQRFHRGDSEDLRAKAESQLADVRASAVAGR